ncbi:MAG: [protein-PII] uridylyltransferase [Rhizobiaceae bacterium]|nr:[protein-PII] uridylyltransferase [Rhizobiaceae bacterium]
MAARKSKLQRIIAADQVRSELTALTRDSGNDGSSPAIRSQVLTILKRVMKDGREAARQQLFEDGNGLACAWQISYLQDEIIRIIHDFAVSHVYRAQNNSSAEQLAITAVGGYGRGTLAPGSDIDLLFVLPYKRTPWCEQVVEYVLYMLWDMGLKVGHATRTIDECIRLSLEDMTIRTSILEVRFIHGTQELYKTLSRRFSDEVVEGTAEEFIAAKLGERDDRHAKTGESRYLVEPNVKDGKGGLRDLHTLFWIGKYFHQVGKSHSLVKAGMFTEKEYRRFRRAEKFLWTVRCHMHFLTGRAQEKLVFDIQRDVAERLNYSSHAGLSGVERFMKHYFLVAKEVGDLTLIACAKLEEKEAKAVTGVNRFIQSMIRRRRKIRGSDDFINDNGRLNVADDGVFKRDPVNLIRFFELVDRTGLDFHPDALGLLAKSLKLVDKKLRQDPEANRIFIDLLSSKKGPERLLRRMNETGFLGKFIPPFGKIVAMMQFNMYHHFTVDEHLIRSVGALWGIENGMLAEEHPLSTELLPQVQNRKILYVALFLHDIAKGRPEDHSIAGEKVARKLCPRFGMTPEETELVAWLVREHLTMSAIAQGRDLSDRKTINDFSEVVQEVDRMRYLVILTVCDIRAVGPGVWNGWKGQLLRTLYYETELMLNGGFSRIPLKARVKHARETLREALEDWPEAQRKKYVGLLYDPYFLSTELEAQIRHMHLLRDTDEQGKQLATSVNSKMFEAITEITIVAQDHPRLLSVIAGACSAAGGNIVDAKIHTTADGRALDSIFINREYSNELDETRRANRIGKMIEEVLSGQSSLPEVMARGSGARKKYRAFSVPATVEINNEFSDTFTVIDIECLDQPGLLSRLTRALAELNLDIGSAHVVTFGEKANDSFYVRDLVGHKIDNPARIRKIRDKLLETMAPQSGKGKAA